MNFPHRWTASLSSVWVCLGSLGVTAPLLADTTTAFFSSNQNPLIQIHDIPRIDTARVLDQQQSRYHLSVDLASNYMHRQNTDESVLLDGETTRMTLSYARGLANDWEWGVQLPYVMHRAGGLDGFIVDWHDAFGLPQGGRDSAPDNRLLYRYQRDGNTEVLLDEESRGVGDLRITAGWQWQRTDRGQTDDIALRAALSLPTGDADKLQGSGSASASVWLTANHQTQWFARPAAMFGGAGLMLLGEGDVLADQQRPLVLFGTAGLGLELWPGIAIKAQGDFHTALYDQSDLTPVTANALQLVFGADIEMADNTVLRAAISEDLTVGASPDVVFHLELQFTD